MHRLNAFLMTHGEDIHSFEELDGFITAVALLPDQLSPAVWYGVILGGLNPEEKAARVAQADEMGMLDLLVRHWRHVVLRLARQEKWEIAAGQDEIYDPDFYWALGFEEGIDQTEEFWTHLAPMREWEQRVPSLRLLLAVNGPDGRSLQRTFEEREALLRQMEQEVTKLYREVRRAG